MMRIIRGLLVLITIIVIVSILDRLLIKKYGNKKKIRFWTEVNEYILDKDLIYGGAISKYSRFVSKEFIENVTTNSLGYRDHEFGKKSTDTYRILTVGDSFTFGHGIENNNETYPKKLEKYLNMKGKKVEVFNVAVRGYSPDQEYRQIVNKLLFLEPDMIIWNFSDLGDLHNTVAHNGDWPTPSLYDVGFSRLIPLDARANWLYVGRYIKERLPTFMRDSNLINFCIYYASQTHLFTRKPNIPDDALTDWAVRKLNLQIEDVKKRTDKRNIILIIAVIPYPYKFSPSIANSKDDDVFANFFSGLRKREIMVISIQDVIMSKGVKPRDLYYAVDYHPNRLGTSMFANVVGEAVFEKVR
ncbi:SGNH/GDSL hydrolase family protein [Candidatus Roizmanbacteria bacterium]|nr:SGNH/GDSL hydrolase family protein [Candidatus Roizmanbacteria bacterium]